MPPLFVNQLTHVILRNALDGCEDPFVLRAAELFFRPQRIMLNEQSRDCGRRGMDRERESGARVAALVVAGHTRRRTDRRHGRPNAASYWHRSDMFDLGLDLSAGQRGLAALAEAMTRWIRHLLAVDVTIEPLAELRDAKFTWYVGLIPRRPGSVTGFGMMNSSTTAWRAASRRFSSLCFQIIRPSSMGG